MDGRQAYVRPSGAGTWSNCYGYAALNAALGTEYVDETDNDVREDGTACHWLAKEVWDGRPVSPGGLSPNDRELTDEMFAAVDEYHALLRSWGPPVVLEQLLPVSGVFTGVQDGTPDAYAYDPYSHTLYVADLKFGFRIVEVWRNPQLIVYAWTLVTMLRASGQDVHRIRLFIYQPRVAHRHGYTREWLVNTRDLALLASELNQAALECYKPNPPCKVNPGCRNCGAAYGCTTLQAAAGSGVEVSYDATPFELNEQQLGYELANLMAAQQHIEHRITGLNTQAESLVRRGRRVPGFELSRTGTRWRWRSGAEPLLRRLGEMLGVEVDAPTKLKTVAKLRAQLPEAIVTMYAEKPEGELKLKLVDPNAALKAFGG